MKVFRCELQVRGYELDAYGHVNNSVYLNYAEYARWCMIEEVSGSMDYFKKNNVAPVVARVEVDYKRPCFLGDKLLIETRMLERKRKIVVFEHQVFKESSKELTTVIRATVVCVNDQGRAVEMPSDFEQLFG